MKRVLLDAVSHVLNSRLTKDGPARVLELGPGDTELLGEVASRHPGIKLVALDINPGLVEFGRTSLGSRAEFVALDLRKPWAKALDTRFDLVYTLQSLHDLGGKSALRDVYGEVARVLVPGGTLLNADFIQPFSTDDPEQPRRFPTTVHETLMLECGFTNPHCIATTGLLGCIAARRSEAPR